MGLCGSRHGTIGHVMAQWVVTAPPTDDLDGTRLFPVVLDASTPFGRCVVVDLALANAAAPEAILACLCREERTLAEGMRGARVITFAGGRVAARRAKERTPAFGTPTLMEPNGAPTAVTGVAVSISHSRYYATALAAVGPGWDVGVDIEALDDEGPEDLLAERILSDAERAADQACDPIPILLRLSLKEAAYKALFPQVGHTPLRCIGVTRRPGNALGYAVTVEGSEVSVIANATQFWDHVLSTAVAK